MATAAATKTNIFKTQLESVRKLQQQGDLPSGITAAAAKLYNSYDGPQTRVAQKPNTNHNNNNNNINTSNNLKQQQQTQQRQQQQHLANLATSFLSTPPESSRPTISMPKSKNYDSDEQQQKQQVQQKEVGSKQSESLLGGKADGGKQANKSSQQGNQNSGWFGGIWNKLSLKPKNQMILPDDKNPSIVWDPEKKRWVNTDGDEATEESFKPPPKMSDLMAQAAPPAMAAPPVTVPQSYAPQQLQLQQQQQPQQHLQPQPIAPHPSPLVDTHQYTAATAQPAAPAPAPSVSPAPVSSYSAHALTGTEAPVGAAKTPSLQSNMFKMQRNRTLKNSYVDVFNPSGAPMKSVENVMAPALPPAAVPQSGFFIPGAVPAAATTADHSDAGVYQQQQQDVPQFYNPNQFSGGAY